MFLIPLVLLLSVQLDRADFSVSSKFYLTWEALTTGPKSSRYVGASVLPCGHYMVLANLFAFLDVQPEHITRLEIDVGSRQAFKATTNATVGADVAVESAISPVAC